ncbi:uncharacterized protein LOC105186953 [Harpegnathos saltator]|uniref:uncharacterized protein LOC105186953 n=1 Tax=Harpegnathos saltator TaxID=610380 RepID=UPI00058E5468|nr:uncharacterized protein LOC105186953 [Harpegnathos saltator]
MLVASICCEVYVTVLPNTTMASRVPRCLFGRPSSRETIELLQEALDEERSKFAKRWGVDPCAEDKENNYQRRTNERSEPACNKKRNSNPYSRQTSIHEYWRARKMCDVSKKPLTSSVDVSKQQNVESSKAPKTSTMTAIASAAKTMSPKKIMSPKKTMASK